jgi:hypothetical protein
MTEESSSSSSPKQVEQHCFIDLCFTDLSEGPSILILRDADLNIFTSSSSSSDSSKSPAPYVDISAYSSILQSEEKEEAMQKAGECGQTCK